MQWCLGCGSFQVGDTCLDCGRPLGLHERGQSVDDFLQEAVAMLARDRADMASYLFGQLTEQSPHEERVWIGQALVHGIFFPYKIRSCLLKLEHHETEALRILKHQALSWKEGQADFGALFREWLDRQMPDAADFGIEVALAICWKYPETCARLWELKSSVAVLRDDLLGMVGALLQARSLGADSVALRYLDALDLQRQGQVDLALSAYDEVLASKHHRAAAYQGKMRLLALLGRHAEAFAVAREATLDGSGTAETWRLFVWLALRLGHERESQRGIEMLRYFEQRAGRDELRDGEAPSTRLAGYPAYGSSRDRTSPGALFALKVPRLLEQRAGLKPAHILVQDWCLRLPERSDTWPLGKLAGQTVQAALITMDRRAYVARFAPALVGREQLSLDELHGWCALVELGRVREVTLATSAPLAPDLEMTLADARMRLGAHADGSARLHHVLIGERDGVLG